MQIDTAPVREGIAGALPNAWVRWFNQCYVAVSQLIANLGSLSAAVAALQTLLAGLQAGYQSWTPALTPAGSMTLSGVTIDYARYIKIGALVHFCVQFHATAGGTAASTILVSLPPGANTPQVTTAITTEIYGPGYVGFQAGGGWVTGGAATVFPSNNANYPLGALNILVTGTFQNG